MLCLLQLRKLCTNKWYKQQHDATACGNVSNNKVKVLPFFTHTRSPLSTTSALVFCHVEPVSRKLRVHPAQPDVPAGGRGPGSVRQDHGFGQECHQEPEHGRLRADRLLQSAGKVSWTRGERTRDRSDTSSSSKTPVYSPLRYLSVCLDWSCQCAYYH